MNENLKTPAWYCVRSLSKREAIAGAHLAKLEGVEVFAPRLKFKKATRRGKIWWSEAMFPGYLFARFVREESEKLVQYSQGVTGFIRFGSELPIIPDAFIEELRKEMPDEKEQTLVVTPKIEKGDEVEIATGAFAGLEGEVIQVLPGVERVRILIEFLGGKQAVDLDLYSLIIGSPRSKGFESRNENVT